MFPNYKVLDKMKKLQTTVFLLLIFTLTSFGQEVKVKTKILSKSFRNITLDTYTDSEIKFPVIKTGNFEIDSSINTDLKKRFTKNESKNLSTDSILIDWANGKIFGLEYEVTSTKNGFISFNITTEIIPYLSENLLTTYTNYYTYDLKTRKYVEFNEVIDIPNDFRERLNSDKLNQFEIQKKELEKELQLHFESKAREEMMQHNTNVPPGYYPDYKGMWRKSELENYNNCKDNLDLNSFALHSDSLEIIFKCCDSDDERGIFNANPVIKLKYNYEDIREYLKVKL